MRVTASYEELKQLLRRYGSAGPLVVAENDELFMEPLAPLNEKLIQLIWQEQLLDPTLLVTVTGKPVRIIDPGRWTGERGPDFHHAEIEIGGTRFRGSIEIHLDAADWDRHQHQRDFEYNTTVLHVALFASDHQRQDELNNGNRLERILIESALQPALAIIRRTFAAEDTSLGFPHLESNTQSVCQQSLQNIDPNLVRDFLTAAARQRVESKAARYSAQLKMETADQVFYQAIMTAMGYKGGKTLFFLLAKRVPIEELKIFLREVALTDLAVTLEAILLHTSNLVPPTPDQAKQAPCPSADLLGDGLVSNEISDDASRDKYLNSIHERWQQYQALFLDRVLPASRRWFSSVRPVNFPMRRIAGVAQLLAHFDFRRGLLQHFIFRLQDSMDRQAKTSRDFRREIKCLAGLFETHNQTYWNDHYSFNSKQTASSMQLIGEDRALSVLYNAFLPLALLHAREQNRPELETYLWRLHENFPALPENTVTRFMRRRLFGASGGMDGVTFRLEKDNQALFQIFHECCSDQTLSCEECIFKAGTGMQLKPVEKC